MKREYETHQEFFENAGDQWLHPKKYGECFWPVTVEEMYQHFKARLMEETAIDAPDLRVMGKLVDVPNGEVRGDGRVYRPESSAEGATSTVGLGAERPGKD